MGKLLIVATPLGNLEDITIRAIKTLLTVPVVACEDTRRTGQLIKTIEERYGKVVSEQAEVDSFQLMVGSHRRYISVRDFNEKESLSVVLAALTEYDVALVSDSGTPLISDPGFKLVRAAREAGYEVTPIPGPSAVTAAISAAGLPSNRFVFWGFWNKKYSLIKEATNIVYESPIRATQTVKELCEKYPSADIVVAREVTKIHEKFVKAADYLADTMGNKGEITILVYLPNDQIRE